MLEVTHRLGGENYVLWGGREGYETLLNTDIAREERSSRGSSPGRRAQAQDRLHGHAADRAEAAGADQAPVRLRRGDGPGLPAAPRPRRASTSVNLEVNHATLAGHSFHHEVATAIALGIFGSVDANRGDYQNGWDTDQFPNSVDELALALHEILRGRRLHERRVQLRRQAPPPEPGPHRPVPRARRRDGHARAVAAGRRSRWSTTARCEGPREARYAGWDAHARPRDPGR